MEKSIKTLKLETFLAVAQDRNKTSIKEAQFRIAPEYDAETNELIAVELHSLDDTFYSVDLIVTAEALTLSCYIITDFTEVKNGICIRVY